MLDYLHGDVAKQMSPTNFGEPGSKFDAFAMRTQVGVLSLITMCGGRHYRSLFYGAI